MNSMASSSYLLKRATAFEWLRVLSLMGVLRAGENFQLGKHLAAKFIFRKHSANSIVYDLLWLAIQTGLSRFFAKSCIACVPGVSFLIQLVAGKLDFLAIGHDNEIACVHVGRVSRAMLAHQNHGDIRSDSADNLVFAIDNPP